MHATESIASKSASNAQAIQEAVAKVYADYNAARPESTSKPYERKQLEFRDWCQREGFDDGFLVSEGKLLLFLERVVIPRGNKRKKHADGSPVPLSLEGIESYVKALVDLHRIQRSLQINKYDHPRGGAVKNKLDTYRLLEPKRKREEYYDRGLGTVLDGYNVEDMKALSHHWMNLGTGVSLRERVDFLLGHALLARGETRRFIQFPDLLVLSLTDEGPQRCNPLVVIMNRGKTNQFGRVEYGAAMRCKDVLLCPINAVAMYLFWRWHVEREPFPDLSERAKWYDIHLLKGKDRTKGLSYHSHVEGIKKAFAACGIDSSVWTHANRGSAARMAELNGADEAQIRRAGRWNAEKMEGCYLTTLPRKCMRALAGFSTKGGGFWLPRNTVEPPIELQRQVYPELERGEQQLLSSEVTEIAGGAFVSMLRELRLVFLQDSVELRRQFPHHRLWEAPIFSSELYQKFERDCIQASSGIEEPKDLTLERAVPHISTALQDGFAALHSKLQVISADIARLHSSSLLSNKKLVLSVVDEAVNVVERSSQPEQQRNGDADVATAGRSQSTETVVPSFRLSRAISTVPDLWREFTEGIGGSISVQEAERLWGNEWRSSATENRFYFRRKEYYDAVRKLSTTQQVTPTEAAEMIERKRLQSGKSLNSFRQDGLKSLISFQSSCVANIGCELPTPQQ